MRIKGVINFGRDYMPRVREAALPYRRLAVALTLAASALVGCSDEGCEPFVVYAHNRWDPLGAALLSAPYKGSEQVGGFKGNTPILVDGYVIANEAYPDNPDPFKGREWLHYAAGGWVTSAAVRATATEPDFTSPDGGPPAVLPRACLNAVRP